MGKDLQQQASDRWVTFLMPVYNGMRYLREAIQSILSQSVQDWELLIVDDQSADDSWDYVQGLTAAHIRVARNARNIGLYGTLNAMLDSVNTPYTCIAFQDDRLHSDYLKQMRTVAAANSEVDMLWCAIDEIDGQGRLGNAGVDSGRFELIAPGAGAWRSALLRGTFWTISGSLTRTSALREYRFRHDLPHVADYDFLLRALLHSPFGYFERPLCDIRIHHEQASAHNLATCRDLHERIGVISEQMASHPELVGASFRLRLMCRLVDSVLRRSLGALRRRSWSTFYRSASLLPRIAPACLLPTLRHSGARAS